MKTNQTKSLGTATVPVARLHVSCDRTGGGTPPAAGETPALPNQPMKTHLALFAATALTGLFTAVHPALAQDWTLTSAPQDFWRAVASSADGTKLVAVSSFPYYSGGEIYNSTNSGVTWTQTQSGSVGWQSVASSEDGTRLVAVGEWWDSTEYEPTIYLSTDSGATWTPTSAPSPFTALLSSVACSEDGIKLVVVDQNDQWIYTSTDGGTSWSSNSVPFNQLYNWTSVASSADGTKLVATAGGPAGLIFTSIDSGGTWVQTSAPSERWSCVASSADGSKLVAGYVGFKSYGGAIYLSTDSGATWQQTVAPILRWSLVFSSTDGSTFVACDGSVYTSTNFGATWTQTTATYYTGAGATSADGRKLIVAGSAVQVYGGGYEWGFIYTSQTTPTPLLSLTPTGSDALVSWIIPSQDFTLQQSPDLLNWTDVTTSPVLNHTNLKNQVTVSPTNNAGFYRLKH